MAEWIQAAAAGFDPDNNLINLADGRSIGYMQLIICPDIRLAWEKIEGLQETLGKNGVTSSYHFDLAPYTWHLTKNLKIGKALFTQPQCRSSVPVLLKRPCIFYLITGCAITCWTISESNLIQPVQYLFGVADFVPPLMKNVKRYHAKLAFNPNFPLAQASNGSQ